MRRHLRAPVVLAATALGGIIVAAVAVSVPGSSSSAADLAALASRGVNIDYDPLSSPREAVDQADLAVTGTLADVRDGVSLRFPDPAYTERWAGSYLTLVIDVEDVLRGDAGHVRDGRVYVQVEKARGTSVERLSSENTRPDVVAVLDDITAWRPAEGVTVRRPSDVPAGAPLFAAFTDGVWLQGSGDDAMYGLGPDPKDLGPAWEGATTVADYAAAIRRAAR